MLKYSVAIAALLLGAPVAFAQGAGDTGKSGGGAGMSSSGPSSSGASFLRIEIGWCIARAFWRVIRCQRRCFRFGFFRL